MILQLNPSIPVNTPKGPGEAILIIDYSKEDDILWTVFLDETGQCWTFNNKDIRAIKNVSIGRTTVEDPKVTSVHTPHGVIKITTDPNMKPGEWAIYGDPGGHTAKAVKGLYEEVKERNKWLSNLDFYRRSVESEGKLVDQTPADPKRSIFKNLFWGYE